MEWGNYLARGVPRQERSLSETLSTTGIKITMYTSEGPESIKMFVKNNELRWQSFDGIRKSSILFEEVVMIEIGKQSHNFRSAIARDAIQDHCFSAHLAELTLDLEAQSVEQRNALYEIFNETVKNIQQVKATLLGYR